MSGNERIGKYRLVAILARSPSGTVIYLGFDEKTERQVAIKVSRKLATPKEIESFLVGTASVAKFDHPHIVPIYDVGRTEAGQHFIVSKFVEGHTLRESIRNGLPTLEESARLMATIAETLHYSHQKGVVHGGLSPTDILLEDNTGNLFVTGFELEKRARDDRRVMFVGNPSYVSPEQIRGESHLLDGRSDIFSLGAIFYELLAGVRPFRCESAIKRLNEIVSTNPVPPRQMNQAVPLELNRICLKALAKQPSDRHSTAEELAHDLLNWQTTPNHGP